MMRPALVLIFLLTHLGGCGANVRTDGRTGGVRIEMLHEGTGNLAEYYHVDRDGALHFAGGKDALLRRVTWSGEMSDEQIDELVALLEAEQLFTDKPASTGEPPVGGRTELKVIGVPGRQTIRVRGQCEAIERLRAFLSEIAAQRFEPFMRTLPQPNVPSEPVEKDAEPPVDD